MSQINLAEQKDLGYVFSSKRRISEPGYSRFDAVLRNVPTVKHFDPMYLRVVVGHDKSADFWSIEHPWSGEKTLRVCAGPLDLVDRKNKRIEIVSFGGQLLIDAHEEWTSVVFTSPAPILLLRAGESIATLLAVETEILLAERCAALESSPGEYDSRLASVDPVSLYRSILCAIQDRLTKLPTTENELWLHFRHVLREETKFMDEVQQREPCPMLEHIL